jgi:RHS repeat-associated protein
MNLYITAASGAVRFVARKKWWAQRTAILALLLVFVGSSFIPTASAMVADAQSSGASQPLERSAPPVSGSGPSVAAAHTKTYDQAAMAKPMRQHYGGPITTSPASYEMAAAQTDTAAPAFSGRLTAPPLPSGTSKQVELTAERTATSQVFRNSDGTYTKKQYLAPHFYKKDGTWQTIDTNLAEDKNAGDAGTLFGKLYGQVQSVFDAEQAFISKANDWQARFSPSDFAGGMVRVQRGDEQVGFKPIGAHRVAPVVSHNEFGRQVVTYPELWDGVDVRYTVNSFQVKEDIIIKRQGTATAFAFELAGATLKTSNKAGEDFTVAGALGNAFAISDISLLLQKTGPLIDGSLYSQTYTDGVLRIGVNERYIQTLPAHEFPVIIDPSFHSSNTAAGYVNIRNDGTSCMSSCGLYAGSNNISGTWGSWRSFFRMPYTLPANSIIGNATLYLGQYTGTIGSRTFQPFHATCTTSYYCTSTVLSGPQTSFDQYGELDVTDIYQGLANVNDNGGWLALVGQECGCQSFKGFDPATAAVDISYNNAPNVPVPEVPSTNPNAEVVSITTQPTIGVSTVTDVNGDAVYYRFRLMSSTGVYLYTTERSFATRVTIPEGLLQDGGAYTWLYLADDGYSDTGWQQGGTIRVDLRTGKDKTSTYEDVGPVSTSLNTGNMYTATDTHSMKALDGSIGLSLNYNSPHASQQGLRASYYNNTSFAGVPIINRNEATIDTDWKTGSPAQNVINADNFAARYEGFFTAPAAGSYQFGASNDDGLAITVNNQLLYNTSCLSGVCWGASITLNAGQTVSFKADYIEYSGAAYAKAYVRGAVAETPLKTEWLHTNPLPTDYNSGLMGHYYVDNGSHDPAQLTEKIMTRHDPVVRFDWSTGAPIPNVRADNFYVRWEGYFIPPATNTYYFGTDADDGTRIKINNTQVMSTWSQGASGQTFDNTGVSLTAGVAVPITVEYYEVTHAAYMHLLYKIPTHTEAFTVEPQYLRPGEKFLPAGWSMSADADGNLAYERIEIRQNGDVITYDGDGSTQTFTNTGSGFKPPVNEEAYLTRNPDATYTLTDADGRVYIFNTDGTLRETAAPIDDRKPAAIKYNYQTINGMPRLTEIIDGVTSSRKATLVYRDTASSGCVTPSSYDDAPAYYLCAMITSDGQRTDLHYKNGRLARVAAPGSAMTSYGYDTNGMITSIVDQLANDAVAAGVRANDAAIRTEITYDALARVASVKAPAATSGATRTEYTFDYQVNATRQHVTGSSEPNGYQQYIEYDNLLRTTKDCDVAALCTTTEWHTTKDLAFASTDAAGLKRTTLYDDDDKPTHQYGPAPATWYDASRTPLSAYATQVPHTQTAYDEGMAGLAVAWHDYKRSGTEPGVLFGGAKRHATGFTTATPGSMTGAFSAPPITAGSGMQGIGIRATGKLRLPAGTYWVNADTADGIRISVDNKMVLDGWSDAAYRTVTGTSFTVAAGDAPKRVQIDSYRRSGTTGNFNIWLRQDSGFAWTTDWSAWAAPDYALATKSTVYDATLGNSISTTNYGANPELGLPQSTSVDPAGLNLTTNNTYEPHGMTGSYLRQTAKYLPGANTSVASTATQYAHYAETDTKDNPCTTGATEAYKQAGFLKLKTEPDPDGTGSKTPRTTETIYDDTGRIVATRYNTDSWTCTTYDTRGRVMTTSIPAYNGQAARTVTNNYAVGGNPLQTATTDANGTILVTNDLLGRNIDYTDVYGDVTTSVYDSQGKLTSRSGQLGSESFVYDTYERLSEQKIDNVTYAKVYYDVYGRTDYIEYPNAGSLKLTYSRDSLGRLTSKTYLMGNGSTQVANAVSRTPSGQVNGETVSSGATTMSSTYAFDAANRLTNSAIGSNIYAYGFGTQNTATCGTGGSANANSGKSSNRTSQTVNGTTTYFCYDYADRLIASNNALYNAATYDTHGNMLSLGSGTTPLHFAYDTSGRSIGYEQTNASGNGTAMYYDRDSDGRIIGRYKSTITAWDYNSSEDWFYGYTGAGDTPDYIRNASWDIVEKTLQLPGDVLLNLKPLESVANNKKQYSLTNIHGDTMLLANAAGTNTSTGNGPANAFVYDPFGNAIGGSVLPANTANASYGWVGQHEKITETSFVLTPIQMGQRVYIPGIGRFTQVDPVEGGTDNNYVYATDPINEFDLDGNAIWGKVATAASIGSMIPGPIGMASSAVAAGAYAASGDRRQALIMAASIGASAVGAGSAVLAYKTVKVGKNIVAGYKVAKVTGRSKNLTAQLTQKEVLTNPRIGKEIDRLKIGDKRFPRWAGWRKMEYTHKPLMNKGKQASVHYFYNKFTHSVRQLKNK